MYNLQIFKSANLQSCKYTNVQMYKCNIVQWYIFTYLSIYKYKKTQICKCTNLLLSQVLCILSGQDQYRASTTRINGYFMVSITKFEKITIFKTALVFIIFILELSVFNKSCLELNFQAIAIISRVPCTTVFLRFARLACFLNKIYFF